MERWDVTGRPKTRMLSIVKNEEVERPTGLYMPVVRYPGIYYRSKDMVY